MRADAEVPHAHAARTYVRVRYLFLHSIERKLGRERLSTVNSCPALFATVP